MHILNMNLYNMISKIRINDKDGEISLEIHISINIFFLFEIYFSVN